MCGKGKSNHKSAGASPENLGRGLEFGSRMTEKYLR